MENHQADPTILPIATDEIQVFYELPPQYANLFVGVSKEQGRKAFWRGNSANLWMHGWQVLAQITLLDSIRSFFHSFAFEMQNDPLSKFVLQRVAGPLVAAASVLAITHPIDTSRVRISMNYCRNPNEMLFTGVTSCWSLIRLEERGIKAIYRGYLIANLIAILHLNIFTSFSDIYQQIQFEHNQLTDLFLSKEVLGSTASLLLLHPLDTIKKNLQLNNQGKPAIFENGRQVLSFYRQNGGLLKLYQGFSVTMARNLLFCPIFAILSSTLTKHVKLFE